MQIYSFDNSVLDDNNVINAIITELGERSMELYPLKVFLTVATERSFSRAG